MLNWLRKLVKRKFFVCSDCKCRFSIQNKYDYIIQTMAWSNNYKNKSNYHNGEIIHDGRNKKVMNEKNGIWNWKDYAERKDLGL